MIDQRGPRRAARADGSTQLGSPSGSPSQRASVRGHPYRPFLHPPALTAGGPKNGVRPTARGRLRSARLEWCRRRSAADNPHSPCLSFRMPTGTPSTSLQVAMQTSRTAAVELYWIPLGAGGHCVRVNGRVFEAIAAARQHRQRCDLYHAALIVELDGDRYTIELAPSPDADEASRGVVATGAVGSRRLGWLRLFRYEVRCWRNGSIPDLGEAVGGPRRLTSDPRVARRLLDLAPTVPTPVWGRDTLTAGEMWNSNSVTAWLIATAGLSTDLLRPPPRGRAPGWDAGLEVARRSELDDRAWTDALLTSPVSRSAIAGRLTIASRENENRVA